MTVYLVWRMDRPMDTINSIWATEELAAAEVERLLKTQTFADGFYHEEWKVFNKG